MQPGDQLLGARLAARDQVAEEVTDKVQISALLEAERAVGGALKNGDLVGVYLSFDPFDRYVVSRTGNSGDEVDVTSAAALAEGSADDETIEPDSDVDSESDDDGPKKTPNVSHLEFQHVLVTNIQTINAPVSPVDWLSSRPSQTTARCSPL